MLLTTEVRETSELTSVSTVEARGDDVNHEAKCHECSWTLMGYGPNALGVVVGLAEDHVCQLRLVSS